MLFAKKKQKLSFAEKQRRRAEKQQQNAAVPETPSDLDFFGVQTPPSEPTTSEPPEKQRAKQLIDAQRKSVDMLTLVRKCVEALPFDDINQALSTDGYIVVDNFLKDDVVIDQLEKEGCALQQDDLMELDVEHGIGSGEYVTFIKGGEEQYQHCPRSIEYVVSVTKHMPSKLLNIKLDSSASLGTMRTYSHKARLASIALLTGEEEDLNTPERPFGLVVEDGNTENDARQVTLLYYPIPDSWADCGGGVEFQGQNDKHTLVEAKRDRLVVLMADTCMHRKEPYKGRDGLEMASCIEVHLVKASQ